MRSSSVLFEVKPLTGEPDAGEPPVRFGGRGAANQCGFPTPIKAKKGRGVRHYGSPIMGMSVRCPYSFERRPCIMAFRDFTFPQVQERLGLRVEDADLFSAIPPFAVRQEIAAFVQDGVALALANSTEKAKSEFIIAPVLLELRRSV